MNRMRNVSGWRAVIAGGLLLALPALAAAPSPEELKAKCLTKASATMNACLQGCPKTGNAELDAKNDKTMACMKSCSEKNQTAVQSCEKNTPKK